MASPSLSDSSRMANSSSSSIVVALQKAIIKQAFAFENKNEIINNAKYFLRLLNDPRISTGISANADPH